jgi:hypothetical protein
MRNAMSSRAGAFTGNGWLPARYTSRGFWEAQDRNKKHYFRAQETLGGILGFWVSGVTSQ